MMLKRYFVLIGLITALAVVSGCGRKITGQGETMLDRNWGRSFESAKHNQILNPDAGKNLDPVTGMDGQAGEGIIKKYRKKSDEKQSAKEFGVLTIKSK
jgi:hypothetical protein